MGVGLYAELGCATPVILAGGARAANTHYALPPAPGGGAPKHSKYSHNLKAFLRPGRKRALRVAASAASRLACSSSFRATFSLAVDEAPLSMLSFSLAS